MDVYGNSEHAGKDITLKLWDASTGNVYTFIESTLNGVVQELKFATNSMRGNANTPVIHNALNIIEQSIALGNGWNWVSFNVENDNPSLLSQFNTNIGDAGILIKGQDGFNTAPVWAGSLASLNTQSMYLINTNKTHVLRMNGEAVNVANTPITLKNGWNWIGYTPQFTLPTSSALAGLNAQFGDQIKGNTGFRTYMGSNGWIGNLDYLRAGEGYMYYSENAATQSFVYPSVSDQVYGMRAPVAEENPYWTDNSYKYKYPNTATFTGFVTLDNVEIQSSRVEVAAFVNNECRGTTILRDFSSNDFEHPYLGFLQIFGEDGEAITFRLYDHETGKEYTLDNSENFVTNAIKGNPVTPYNFFKAPTGIDEIAYELVQVYPSPAQSTLWIKHSLGVIDMLEVIDISGRVVMRAANFNSESINVSTLESGVYVIKCTKDGKTHILKFTKE
jgi:hypothetical protein